MEIVDKDLKEKLKDSRNEMGYPHDIEEPVRISRSTWREFCTPETVKEIEKKFSDSITKEEKENIKKMRYRSPTPDRSTEPETGSYIAEAWREDIEAKLGNLEKQGGRLRSRVGKLKLQVQVLEMKDR
jgi:hypothetical protein